MPSTLQCGHECFQCARIELERAKLKLDELTAQLTDRAELAHSALTPKPKRFVKMDEALSGRIRSLRDAGKTITEIGRELGVPKGTVHGHFHKGLKKSKKRSQRARTPPEVAADIVTRWTAGQRPKDISKDLGLNANTVYSLIAKARYNGAAQRPTDA